MNKFLLSTALASAMISSAGAGEYEVRAAPSTNVAANKVARKTLLDGKIEALNHVWSCMEAWAADYPHEKVGDFCMMFVSAQRSTLR
jgi:hypothetical protein